MAAVRAAFKPEFLNRLDDVVLFDPLSLDELGHIVELQVAALREPARRTGGSRSRSRRPRASGSPWRGTTRRTARGRCGGWCSARSATGWRG